MSVKLLAAAAAIAIVGTMAMPAASAQQPRPQIGKNDAIIERYKQAMDYYKSGQFKRAETELNQFLESAGSHAGGNLLMGLVQIELADYAKALLAFKAAVKWDPNMISPRGYIGAIEAINGHAAAVTEQQTALAKFKTDCAGTCPKAAEIDAAIQRIQDNVGAAAAPATTAQ